MITKPIIQKRRGRPLGSGNPTLRLTCLVNGSKRATNIKYVEKKARKLGVSVEDISENYISKEGLKMLDSMPELAERKEFLIRLNGGKRFRQSKKTPPLTYQETTSLVSSNIEDTTVSDLEPALVTSE